MLEHNNFDVYKYYEGFICFNTDSILRIKGAFNQVNIGKVKEEYIISLEHCVIDNNFLNKMYNSNLVPGKTVRLQESPVSVDIIYKVSKDSIIPNLIKEEAKGKEVKEWSISNAIPQLLVTGDIYNPHISRLLLLSFKANSFNINSDISKSIQQDANEIPIRNRVSSPASIYGPLV